MGNEIESLERNDSNAPDRNLGGGVINVLFFVVVMNPHNFGTKPDEVALNTYVLNFFVGWMLFSAWFLAKVDEEFKKCQEAVTRKDKETFLVEAPKRIALSIRILYLMISLMVVVSFHLFHLQSILALVEIQFGVAFFVAMTILVLWDLDDPTAGVIVVSGIPKDWVESPKER